MRIKTFKLTLIVEWNVFLPLSVLLSMSMMSAVTWMRLLLISPYFPPSPGNKFGGTTAPMTVWSNDFSVVSANGV